MPSIEIPCSDCAAEKRRIEAMGTEKVTECVEVRPGWCRLTWVSVPLSAMSAGVTPAAVAPKSHPSMPAQASPALDQAGLVQKLVKLALGEVGTRESGGNNMGGRIVEYQGATWLAPGAWPWCAAFTAWVLREWLEDDAVRSALGFSSFSLAEKWRCRDASAFGWEKWAAQKGLLVLSEVDLAREGDFVVFDFSHIGIVVKNQNVPSEHIHTVEGNTNGKGTRDSESGDGVWEKTRDPRLTKSYIRIVR